MSLDQNTFIENNVTLRAKQRFSNFQKLENQYDAGNKNFVNLRAKKKEEQQRVLDRHRRSNKVGASNQNNREFVWFIWRFYIILYYFCVFVNNKNLFKLIIDVNFLHIYNLCYFFMILFFKRS